MANDPMGFETTKGMKGFAISPLKELLHDVIGEFIFYHDKNSQRNYIVELVASGDLHLLKFQRQQNIQHRMILEDFLNNN